MKCEDLEMLLAGINPDCSRGYFYVQKINILARFSFGRSGSFDSAGEAHDALKKYLAKRRDRKRLTIGFYDLPA